MLEYIFDFDGVQLARCCSADAGVQTVMLDSVCRHRQRIDASASKPTPDSRSAVRQTSRAQSARTEFINAPSHRLSEIPAKITPADGEKAYKDPLGLMRPLFERTALPVELVSKLVPREFFSTGLPARRCWISMQAPVLFAGSAPRFAISRFFATQHKPLGIFPQL